ncbi:unnamed protein product, partial [Nesidiocoris tenuis]
MVDIPLFMDDHNTSIYSVNMEEEMEERPRISTLISSLANYSNTIPAAESADPDAKPQPSGGASMGTLVGVYLPCIQNIFGVILFIRLTWVVGTAGAIQDDAHCHFDERHRNERRRSCGRVVLHDLPITRSRVRRSGGNALLHGHYTCGRHVHHRSCRDRSVVMGTIVYIGVKFVNKFAGVALACVILSIVAVYVGIFVNFYGNDKLRKRRLSGSPFVHVLPHVLWICEFGVRCTNPFANSKLEAEIQILSLTDNDISAYTYERTLMMEQRNQMLKELRLNKREALGMVRFPRFTMGRRVKSYQSAGEIDSLYSLSQRCASLYNRFLDPGTLVMLSNSSQDRKYHREPEKSVIANAQATFMSNNPNYSDSLNQIKKFSYPRICVPLIKACCKSFKLSRNDHGSYRVFSIKNVQVPKQHQLHGPRQSQNAIVNPVRLPADFRLNILESLQFRPLDYTITGFSLQVQAIVDQHHDVKQATKVRFQEPSAGSGEADKDKDKDTKQLSLA